MTLGRADGDARPWPAVVSERRLANSFLGRVVEIGIVTADCRRTMEGLVRLGIGPWRIYTFTPDDVQEQTFRGAPAAFTLRVCFAEADGVIWELMEPVDGPTVMQEFLDRHGEGIHHLAFDCEDRPWEDRLGRFAAEGFALAQSGAWRSANRFAFFDTEAATTTTLETYVFPDDWEYPEPDAWFPGPPPAAA
jgi:hypothetical protein